MAVELVVTKLDDLRWKAPFFTKRLNATKSFTFLRNSVLQQISSFVKFNVSLSYSAFIPF